MLSYCLCILCWRGSVGSKWVLCKRQFWRNIAGKGENISLKNMPFVPSWCSALLLRGISKMGSFGNFHFRVRSLSENIALGTRRVGDRRSGVYTPPE
jgi:hypothetical protein